MKIVQYILWTLWRIWFYILMGVPIIVLSPLLILSILSEKTYPQFFILARLWAKIILWGMGLPYRIVREQQLEQGKSYMLVANHTSMTDIMLMLVISKNPFVFVGKKELVKIPIFGFFYKRTCILVDRSSSKSRFEVFKRAQARLNQGLSICIFPEGGVPDDENVILDEFKDGAFRLAIEHQIPIVPMTFYDNKKRFSFKFFSGSPGLMRAKVHEFVGTEGLRLDDKKDLKDRVRQIIYKELLKDQK
ncbi:1-acyl-sn-glycerol-3-phosphate acyltransferase [Flavobacterium sp. MFBS3-15]|uniref:lysophospholipid acyltransferase family protein n=1 Tax=Flavobacterium sp. MFBS3-15 TaxID=2989816 RepID=UPI002235F30A|nr:lysophospholipid acyltransferase family protein [Flavobacterium sp. MFBS3-15]MCW4469239.1 1-acyl-sn-glycerol-3-phosphate acyltransferase [Flavobacterium sp. MFBS3-15]